MPDAFAGQGAAQGAEQVGALARAVLGDRLSSLRVQAGTVTLIVDASGLDADARAALEQQARDALAGLAGVDVVRVAMTAARSKPRLIAIGSGKGGVGKSTLTTNIALALAAAGRKVGIVDADIHGPSQTKLLGQDGGQPTTDGEKLNPVPSRYGVNFLSMGQLAKPGQAVAWRGPMAGRALEQLIDANWGACDLLLLDLPPGTGDVQLSIIQKHKPAGAIIVSTPQDLALIDAARAIDLFRQANVPIIGMVENMSGYACPHCGEVSDPFGQGGAEKEAAQMGMDFMGRVPLDRSIRLASDAGVPPVAQGGDIAQPFCDIAAVLGRWLDANPG